MPNSAMNNARAANRDVPNAAPAPFQDCSDVVHISIFFDGTGNNKDVDEGLRRWSNPARMWRAAQMTAQQGQPIYPIYISGVGTPFNGKATGWLDSSLVWIEDKAEGMGFGGGGDRRMEIGADNVNERLRDVLIANAQRLGGPLRQYADQSKNKSFAEVNKALGQHRLIRIINLSIFGFSRGAALARAFSNRVLDQCKREGKELTYQGIPIRLNFMGLFDTVASFGVPAQNLRYPWDERELIVSHDVERCVHYVAAHEVRFSFPVDLIRKSGQLRAGWEEKTYPGVHSDVGGGYEPQAQGITNNYARIPMRDMMEEAVASGVRMLRCSQIKTINFPLFQERFECTEETEKAYRAYIAAVGSPRESIEQQLTQHLRHLYAAYGTMHRAGVETVHDRRWKEAFFQYLGPKGMAWEVAKYRTATKLGRRVRLSDENNVYAQYVRLQDWQLNAWDSTAAPGVVDFVGKLVHDSKVDFVGNIEPFSYFRMRGVQESTRSVWHEAGDWIGGQVDQVERSVQSVYDSTKRKTDEVYDITKRKAKEVYEAGKSKASAAYEVTKQKTTQAYETTKQKVGDAYDATAKAADEVAVEANRRFDEASDGAQRIVERGNAWVADAANAISDKTTELVSKAKGRLSH